MIKSFETLKNLKNLSVSINRLLGSKTFKQSFETAIGSKLISNIHESIFDLSV